uniref:Protein kinase domain-containing protein n=1 Tax=Oryza sativa subsp. japonica TaxID=39947 RepID=Q6H8A2_ORYSJ|nr:hypothetical protein [Oryza sativa Japonica Group]
MQGCYERREGGGGGGSDNVAVLLAGLPARPQYGLGNEVSILGDIYSYGILLLEMFTGKRPTGTEFKEALSLHNYVKMALPDNVIDIADQHLLSENNDGEERNSDGKRKRHENSLHHINSADWSFLLKGISSRSHAYRRCFERVAENKRQV